MMIFRLNMCSRFSASFGNSRRIKQCYSSVIYIQRGFTALSSSIPSPSPHQPYQNTTGYYKINRGEAHLGHSLKHQPRCLQLYTSRRHLSRQFYENWLSADTTLVGGAKYALEHIHDFTGLPWWLSIALTTIALRSMITLPLTLLGVKNAAKIESLKPELDEKAKILRMEVAHAMKAQGWDENMARAQFKFNIKRIIQETYERENCHPLKTHAVIVAQLPLWISLSLALRNMSGSLNVDGIATPVLTPSLASEGILWFPNLLVPETTFLLPVTMGLVNLLITEMATWKPGTPGKLEKGITNFFRGLSVVMIPVAAVVPSCVCWYWTCSSLFGLTTNILLRLPSVKRTLGFPGKESDSDTPIKDMLAIAKRKYTRQSRDSGTF